MTERVAIYCPGPSMLKVVEHGFPIHRIGVNEAVEGIPCDWWVFKDLHVFEDVTPLVEPDGILTVWGFEKWRYRKMPDIDWIPYSRTFKGRVRYWMDFEIREMDRGWRQYSVFAAILLAYQLGADQIDCYGCDQAGVSSFDGRLAGAEHRSEDRWATERATWAKVQAWLLKRSTVLRRHLPVASSPGVEEPFDAEQAMREEPKAHA